MSYRALISAATDTFHADPRVRGVHLGGSRGRGAADDHSDVDIVLSADAADHESLVTDMNDLVADIGEIVHAQRIGRLPVFTYIAKPWLRFDISITTPAELPTGGLINLTDDRPATPVGPATTAPPLDPAIVEGLTREFLRASGLLPVVVGRHEYALGVAGFGLLHGLTIRAIRLSATGSPLTGMMTLRELASPEIYERLEALPPVEADPDSVIAAHLACAELFLPLARELHRLSGAAWPQAMADALFEHLAAEVDPAFGKLAD